MWSGPRGEKKAEPRVGLCITLMCVYMYIHAVSDMVSGPQKATHLPLNKHVGLCMHPCVHHIAQAGVTCVYTCMYIYHISVIKHAELSTPQHDVIRVVVTTRENVMTKIPPQHASDQTRRLYTITSSISGLDKN